MLKVKKGFTLIELMIVVAILGILAAVAIPKFSDLIRKSKEGATKGSQGSVKSALSIYYGSTEGVFPNDLTTGGFTIFLEAIPQVKAGISGHSDSSVISYDVASAVADTSVWLYTSVSGGLKVHCTHSDTKGSQISSW